MTLGSKISKLSDGTSSAKGRSAALPSNGRSKEAMGAVVETTFTDTTPRDRRRQRRSSPSTDNIKKKTRQVRFADTEQAEENLGASSDVKRRGVTAVAALVEPSGVVATASAFPSTMIRNESSKSERRRVSRNIHSSPRGEGKTSKRERRSDGGAAGEGGPNADDDKDEAHSLVDSSGSSESLQDEDEENLSELASMDSDDVNSKDKSSFMKARCSGKKLAYPVLYLRFLPQEFQEPQLCKFLSQFGAEVLNCFCVRSRRTHQSKGIAYIQFDRESILKTVVEECHGMLLGGRAVQAKTVVLHRAMPSKESVAKRRQLAYAYKTKGAPLKRHNVSKKSPVALLVKAARTEKQNNAHLKSLGIDYATDFFTSQLCNVPAHLIDDAKRPRGVKLGKPFAGTAKATDETNETSSAPQNALSGSIQPPAKGEAAKEDEEIKADRSSGNMCSVDARSSKVRGATHLEKPGKTVKCVDSSKKQSN